MEKLEFQQLIEKMVKKYDLETTIESRYIDLVSEVGELGKEILKGTSYGKKEFDKTENFESEIGDALFSLTCIANTLDINIEEALYNSMKKYNQRFKQKGDIGSSKDKEIDN